MTKEQSTVKKYNCDWEPLQAGKNQWIPCPDWFIELQILQIPEGSVRPSGYRGFRHHFMEFVTGLLGNPQGIFSFEWNPNAERILDAVIGHKYVAIAGCGSSGKSRSLSGIALCWWLIDPFNTKILVTSTTVKTAKGKIWGDICEAWAAASMEAKSSTGGAIVLPGTLLNSTQQIRFEYDGVKSDKAGLELIPTDANKQKEASEKLQGYKRGNVILLGDEWDTLPPMLLKTARSNLFTNPTFRLWGAFNPTGRFTNGGILAKPKEGWESIDENCVEWETERGVCIRFDGLRSPNILAGKVIWRGLYSHATLAEHKRDLGEDSPAFWTMCRGWFPPTGEANTLYSEAELVTTYSAHLTVERSGGGWLSEVQMVAGLDPSWTHGGDRAVLVIGKCGIAQFTAFGKRDTRRVYEKLITIVLDNEIKDRKADKTEQMIVLVKKYLEQYKVPARNLAVDVTGAAPFVTLLNREIGTDYIRLSFGAKPSETRISKADKRKSCDVYRNVGSELWCVGKELLRGGQIKGLDDDTMEEMCSRPFKPGNAEKGVLTEICPKDQMKKLAHRSPDKADALFISISAARARCSLSGLETPKPRPAETYERAGLFTESFRRFGIIKGPPPPRQAVFEAEKHFVAGGWGDE